MIKQNTKMTLTGTLNNGYRTPLTEMTMRGNDSVNTIGFVCRQELNFTTAMAEVLPRTKWRFAWSMAQSKSLLTQLLCLTNNTHPLESILRFLKVPSDGISEPESSKNVSILKEVDCYIWYPDDDRRHICKEALGYLRNGVESRGINIKEHHVDLSHFNLDFPVIIVCLPPRQPQKMSLGDMPVALVLIRQCPSIIGSKDTPLADDLYWRRYKNLSIIMDLEATNDLFEDTKLNIHSTKLLSEFLQPVL